jgi:hypothetical protein
MSLRLSQIRSLIFTQHEALLCNGSDVPQGMAFTKLRGWLLTPVRFYYTSLLDEDTEPGGLQSSILDLARPPFQCSIICTASVVSFFRTIADTCYLFRILWSFFRTFHVC